MTAKRKRPKVRFAVDKVMPRNGAEYWIVEEVHDGFGIPICRSFGQTKISERKCRRIAAALNLYEAVKRGEI